VIERNGHILIDLEEAGADVAHLVRLMQEKNQPLQVCSKGEPVAELSPIRRRRPLGSDPLLKATFVGDPVRLTTEEDWPEELRADLAPKNPDDAG
jgi:antitoxin (DNA-binding transcriptional repressor) of toxin-antitoxin stability system